MELLLKTEFPDLKLFKRGKVRDVYDLDDKLLIVSTDRISCFDVVLPNAIPEKGRVLTELSLFWFKFTEHIVPNHFIRTLSLEEGKGGKERDFNHSGILSVVVTKYLNILHKRSMLVKKAEQIPVECVVRGYLSGSGWKEYTQTQSICGIKLPPGLKESAKLPEPIFTPSTKEDVGHDINVTQDYVATKLGTELTQKLKDISLQIYTQARDYAENKGIIIADTKFEFGLDNGQIILIDEVLTPDSSRFWPKGDYRPGGPQPSFDKQFVRDYLETLTWDKTPPAPELPAEIIAKTSAKYRQALAMLTE